jgi:hypothetical protein
MLKKLEERDRDPEYIRAREEWEKSYNDRIAGVVREIKQDITGKPEPPKQLQLFSPLPDDICRTSPFFPMSKREMKDRPFEQLQWETSWGRIEIEGRKLSIFDETVLLAILYLRGQQCNDITVEIDHYTLCIASNISPSKNSYKAIDNAIKRLIGTVIHLERWKNRKRNESELVLSNTILFAYQKDIKKKKATVCVNPYFVEMYQDGMVTGIDVCFRKKLNGDVSKAIYRFLQSQKPFYQKSKYSIHLLKFCRAINVDNTQVYKMRENMRKGLKELRKHGYLKRWMIDKQDIVTVWKGTITPLVK